MYLCVFVCVYVYVYVCELYKLYKCVCVMAKEVVGQSCLHIKYFSLHSCLQFVNQNLLEIN